jgi:hypothetical protein
MPAAPSIHNATTNAMARFTRKLIFLFSCFIFQSFGYSNSVIPKLCRLRSQKCKNPVRPPGLSANYLKINTYSLSSFLHSFMKNSLACFPQ